MMEIAGIMGGLEPLTDEELARRERAARRREKAIFMTGFGGDDRRLRR